MSLFGVLSTAPSPDSRCYPAEIHSGCHAPGVLHPLGGLSCPKALPLFWSSLPQFSFPTFLLVQKYLLAWPPFYSTTMLPPLSYLTFPLAPLYSHVVFTLALAQHPTPCQSLGALHPHPRQTPTSEQVHVCLGLCVLQLRSKPGASHSRRPMFFV